MEKSGFFNSSGGDRVYSATDFAAYFGKLVSNGIFYAAPTNLQVTPGSGMAVSVASGSAWINGYSYENTDTLTINLATANEGVSMLENAGHLGLPIPAKLKAVLEQLHDRSEKEDK